MKKSPRDRAQAEQHYHRHNSKLCRLQKPQQGERLDLPERAQEVVIQAEGTKVLER